MNSNQTQHSADETDDESAAATPNAIEAKNVSFTYTDGTQAVQNVDFAVSKGEFFGFLGPNGAGKTTTIKTLVSLLRLTTGHVSVNGYDVEERPAAVRASVGYTAQETSVDSLLTARENMKLLCDAYHVPRDERASRIDELLKLVDLADVAERKAKTFSGGMKKRLDIAMSLVHRPPLVFLDEPTTGLDPEARLRLWEHFREINADDTTVFLTTQYMEEADRLCSRIAVLADGEIIAVGTPKQLKSRVGGDTLEITFESATAADRKQAQSAIEESGRLSEDEAVGTTEEGVVISSPRARQIGTDLLVALNEHGFTIEEFSVRSPTLDDVYLQLTGSTLQETQQRSSTGGCAQRNEPAR